MSLDDYLPLKVLTCNFMPPDKAMTASRQAFEYCIRLSLQVERRQLTEDEAIEELELWMLRELAAGRNPAILITNIGQEKP